MRRGECGYGGGEAGGAGRRRQCGGINQSLHNFSYIRPVTRRDLLYSTEPIINNTVLKDFPSGPVVKNPPANARDMGLIPGPIRVHMPWEL